MKRTVAKPTEPSSSSKTKSPEGWSKISGLKVFRSGTKARAVRNLASAPNRSTDSRRKAKTPAVDARVTEYAQVLTHAVDIFGSRIRANAWLNRPNRIFNNQSPIQVLTQDPEAVEEELVRIDEGIFF